MKKVVASKLTRVNTTQSVTEYFISELEGLVKADDRAALAVLRRNAGRNLGKARGALGLFYRLLPMRLGHREEIYFLVATLFPWNDNPPPEGNLGHSMALLRAKTDSDALDRRMTILLDADFEYEPSGALRPGELGFRLRQTVKLLSGHDIGINWRQLLADLLNWSHPDRWVQKQWAREYFGRAAGANEEQD